MAAGFTEIRAEMAAAFSAVRTETTELGTSLGTQMRVLHEEAISRIALLHAGPGRPNRRKSRKK